MLPLRALLTYGKAKPCIGADETKNIMSQRNLQQERKKSPSGVQLGQVAAAQKQRVFLQNASSTRRYVPQTLSPCILIPSDEKESLLPSKDRKTRLVPFGLNVLSRITERKW